jgi:hypothetical protein
MVAWGSILAVALLGCRPEPSDAQLYHRALVQTQDYEAAAALCARIRNTSLAGDCQVALMERAARIAPMDCATIGSDLWRDECVFLLAERLWRQGEHAEGLSTCRQTRFARACTWHLIQDEAEAAAGEDALTAERRLMAFSDSGVAPDAALQFWKLWLRARLTAGSPISAALCEGLSDVRSCREAVGRTIHELLEASGRQDPTTLCAAPEGQRVSVSQGPAWVSDELTLAAERQWVARHCAAPAGGR